MSATVFVTAVNIFAITLVPTLVCEAHSPLSMISSVFANGDVVSLIVAIVRAIVAGYVALVLVKMYGGIVQTALGVSQIDDCAKRARTFL